MTSSRPIDLTLNDSDTRSTLGSIQGHEIDHNPSSKFEQAREAACSSQEPDQNNHDGDSGENDEDNCSICLHRLEDRTVIPKCSHEFCFECLLVWIGQSRRCPLCNQSVGEYVIHNIRSRYDYQKHFFPPLKSASPSRRTEQQTALHNVRERAARRRRERRRNDPHGEMDETDRLERSIQRRRWIYEHDLYAKHVGSNKYTKYRPYPTPSQFSASPDLISRTTTFLRRELRVWEGLDVEFLTNLIISLMKSIDIRSESAVKLLAEFLDMDAGGKCVNAEHFAHEVYCYIRSPYKDLFVYDTIVQYDTPAGLQPPSEITRGRRWHHRNDSRSPSPQASGSQGGYSRGEASRGGQSEANHMIDPLPRSKRNAPQVESRMGPEYVASSSRLILADDALSTGQTAGSSISSTCLQSLATSPTPLHVTKSESHTHGILQHHEDRKGKGRDRAMPVIPTMPQHEPSVDMEASHRGPTTVPRAAIDTANSDAQETQAGRSTGTSRQPIRKDLKTSILSHLALPTTGKAKDGGQGPSSTTLDESMIID